jgi:hypothetical protein
MVQDAKAEIDSAVSAGDLSRLASVVHDSARIITRAGDTVSGAGTIAAWLVRDTAVRVTRVSLVPLRSGFCSDGMLEWGGNAVVSYSRNGRDEKFSEPYTLRWVLESDGKVRATYLALGDPGRRPAGVYACPSRAAVRARDARLTLWLAPPYVTADMSGVPGDFTKHIRRAGYGGGRLSRAKHPLTGYEGTDIRDNRLGVLGARMRISGPYAVEVVQPIGKSEAQVQGYDATTLSHVSLDHEARYSAAMGSYRWKSLRVGAGPFRVSSRWRQRESPIELVNDTWTARGPVITEEGRSTAWGLISQGTVIVPIGGIFATEGFFQYRGFANADIPGTAQSGPVSVNTGGLAFGLIFGWVF